MIASGARDSWAGSVTGTLLRDGLPLNVVRWSREPAWYGRPRRGAAWEVLVKRWRERQAFGFSRGELALPKEVA